MGNVKKVGIVTTTNLSIGGGYPRVAIDLIAALNRLNKKVYLMTPFKLDFKKIEDFHGVVDIEKIYYPQGFRKFFCKEDTLIRKFMKKQFQEMANEVDIIIDIDGRVNHRYLPKTFDKSKYIVWRVSGGVKMEMVVNTFSRHVKDSIRILLSLNKKDWPTKDIKIYGIDNTTKKRIAEGWKIPLKEIGILYPEIKTNEFKYGGEKKKNQIIVFGRISPEKDIENSIKIFNKGTLKNKKFRLVIIGGVSPETKNYINKLNKLISNLKISNRIKVIPDAEFSLLKKVLKESKILIDSQKNANLTMTAIESLAAGCVVLAHNSGGTYKEILNNGEYGYGFGDVSEGGEKLEKIIRGIKNNKININNSIKRAEFFSSKKFRERLRRILNGI